MCDRVELIRCCNKSLLPVYVFERGTFGLILVYKCQMDVLLSRQRYSFLDFIQTTIPPLGSTLMHFGIGGCGLRDGSRCTR